MIRENNGNKHVNICATGPKVTGIISNKINHGFKTGTAKNCFYPNFQFNLVFFLPVFIVFDRF